MRVRDALAEQVLQVTALARPTLHDREPSRGHYVFPAESSSDRAIARPEFVFAIRRAFI